MKIQDLYTEQVKNLRDSTKLYNGHVVRRIGYLQFYVTSASREEITHLVDLEGNEFERGICSCEAYEIQKHRPCRHIHATIDFVVDGIEDGVKRAAARDMLDGFYAGMPMGKILAISQDAKLEPKKRIYKLQKVA